MDSILDSEQAARFLGIQRATLYVYVSRGLLAPVRSAHNGKSYFRLEDLEEFSRKRRVVAPALPAITTSITTLGPRGPVYRGIPVEVLIGVQRFESVAELLWQVEAEPWPHIESVDAEGVSPREAVTLSLARSVATDPSVIESDPLVVTHVARQLIMTCAHAIVGATSNIELSAPPSISALLTAGFQGPGNRHELRRTLETMLIAFADHELEPSTLVVRIAASERVGIASALLAGLGTLGSYLRESISDTCELLSDAAEKGAEHAVSVRLARAKRLPGFGHGSGPRVTEDRQSRADLFMRSLSGILNESQHSVVDAVVGAALATGSGTPGIRFVAAALAWAEQTSPYSAVNVLLLSRMAGWTAHYLEECAMPPRRFRVAPSYLANRPEL